jgi:hypothetical protein
MIERHGGEIRRVFDLPGNVPGSPVDEVAIIPAVCVEYQARDARGVQADARLTGCRRASKLDTVGQRLRRMRGEEKPTQVNLSVSLIVARRARISRNLDALRLKLREAVIEGRAGPTEQPCGGGSVSSGLAQRVDELLAFPVP